MKKILLLLLAFTLLLSGCVGTGDNGKIKISTTIFPEYDFARAVAGDVADVSLLIPAGSDMHAFEPTARDIAEICDSDVFIYIGGESDSWVKKILENIDANKTRLIKISDHVALKSGEHGEYDEHIWTSPDNAQKMVNVIANTLSDIDASNSQRYRDNAKKYCDQIELEAQKTKEIVNAAKSKKIIVADRFPLKYFTEYYGLSHDAAFGGCEHDTDVGITTVTRLIEQVKKDRLTAVYYVELSNKNIAKTVADACGVPMLELHSAHNVSAKDFKDGVTYVDIMRRNAEALKKGLN